MTKAGFALLVLVVSVSITTTPSAAAPTVDARQASFSVVNTNTSRVVCPSDGGNYTVRATLVGPAEVLASGRAPAVTVYVPSFGFSSYWRLGAVPGYDHAAAMAEAGHVSLVYDPLGYGASDKPAGMDTCLGSSADVLHQVIGALRGGGYTVDGAPPVRFDRVVVASHTSGALITQPEAYSYGDVDGLIVTSWADFGFTEYFWQNTLESSLACAAGGEPVDGETGPGGYTFIPPRDRFTGTYFVDADEGVAAAAAASQRRAPCGDFASAGVGAAANHLHLGDVTAPVLLVYGENDALFDQPTAGEQQRDRFSGAPLVDLAMVPGAGSALALERSAPTLRSTVAGWLCTNALSADAACAAAPAPRSATAPAASSRTAAVSAGSATAPILPLTGAELPTKGGVILLGLAMFAGALRERSPSH